MLNYATKQLVALALVLSSFPAGPANAEQPILEAAITSVALDEENLVLTGQLPVGTTEVNLEFRPALDVAWQSAKVAVLEFKNGQLTVATPRPSSSIGFFRLSGKSVDGGAELLTKELQYVAIPSLGTVVNERSEAVFHFKGIVDGSDKLVITRDGAFWDHVNWDWPPQPVMVNGIQWDVREKAYLTTGDGTEFLPKNFSLERVELEIIQGRDIIALERSKDALIVYMNDTLLGASEYEFKLAFHPATIPSARPQASTSARLTIAAQIDGSDCLKITRTEATWEHKTWGHPTGVRLNGIDWDVVTTPVLVNDKANPFLHSEVDFITAKIVSRVGRDVATVWGDGDALWVFFADNPNGSDFYELQVSFGD